MKGNILSGDNLSRDIFGQLPGLLVIMDKQSKFVFANTFTAKIFGYAKPDDIQGINAFDMRCKAAESAPEFISQDKVVVENQQELTILDIHTYADNQPKMLLTKKKPLMRDNEVAGIICHCTELQSNHLTQIFAAIMQADKTYYPATSSTERSYLVGETKSHSVLTNRENDVVFYMIRGQTIKQIGKSIGISPRTVETHKENIKRKWACTLTSEIVDKAISLGYLTYLPRDIVSDEFTGILA